VSLPVLGAVVAAGAAMVVCFVLAVAWRVPGADEALVVTGRRPRIVRAGGSFVWPRLERCGRVDLSAHLVTMNVDVAAAEGIAFQVAMESSWQVRADDDAIAAAARHFGGRPEGPEMAERQVRGVVAARLRATVGALPGAALAATGVGVGMAATVAAGAGNDLGALGLTLVRLDVTAVADPSGYLADLARPHLARAASQARIASARAEAEAVRVEHGIVVE